MLFDPIQMSLLKSFPAATNMCYPGLLKARLAIEKI